LKEHIEQIADRNSVYEGVSLTMKFSNSKLYKGIEFTDDCFVFFYHFSFFLSFSWIQLNRLSGLKEHLI